MFLIQSVTHQTTDEILGFFYDFGKEVLIQGIAKMEGRSIRKDIRDYYPGTAIPFKLLCEAYKWSGSVSGATIYVEFPDNSTHIDTEELIQMIMERELLGGSALPPFEQPKSRNPKMYKDLIEKVLRGRIDKAQEKTTQGADESSSEEV